MLAPDLGAGPVGDQGDALAGPRCRGQISTALRAPGARVGLDGRAQKSIRSSHPFYLGGWPVETWARADTPSKEFKAPDFALTTNGRQPGRRPRGDIGEARGGFRRRQETGPSLPRKHIGAQNRRGMSRGVIVPRLAHRERLRGRTAIRRLRDPRPRSRFSQGPGRSPRPSRLRRFLPAERHAGCRHTRRSGLMTNCFALRFAGCGIRIRGSGRRGSPGAPRPAPSMAHGSRSIIARSSALAEQRGVNAHRSGIAKRNALLVRDLAAQRVGGRRRVLGCDRHRAAARHSVSRATIVVDSARGGRPDRIRFAARR